jgi:GNAT acetyltransferase-like protein
MTAQERIARAEDLPASWDALAANPFQRREFLAHCERENPCGQRYHLLRRGGEVEAGAVVYSLRIDLLAFLGVGSPLTMQVVGIPCSVSSSGLLGAPEAQRRLLGGVLEGERGMVLVLNLEEAPDDLQVAVGRTFPDVVLENRFRSFDQYRHALRAPYRRRLDEIVRREAELTIETGPCDRFSEEMHRMYLAVLRRSEGRLEQLTERFFRTLPPAFRLTTFHREGRLRGWIITVADGDRFWFFLGGQDYDGDPRALYLVKLLAVLRQGIASGARTIVLGQSAEIPKLRLGGTCREKTMLGWHHRWMMRGFLRLGATALSYRRRPPPARVFRKGAA